MIATTIETTELVQLLYNLGIDPPEEGDVTEVSHEEVITQNGDGEPEKHETDERKIQHEDGTVEKETHHDGVASNYAVDPDDDEDEESEDDDEDGDDELEAEDDDDDLDYEEDEAAENENDEHEIKAADDVDEPDTELDAEKDELSGPANDLIGQPSHHTSADDK